MFQVNEKINNNDFEDFFSYPYAEQVVEINMAASPLTVEKKRKNVGELK